MNREKIYRIFSDMPTLLSERLTLRPMRESDAEDMYEYACKESVTKYLLWSPHKSLAYTRAYLKYIENRYAVGDFYDFAIVENRSGKMIGTCGFAAIDTVNNLGELGYVLNPAYRHRGIATEAAKRVIEFGFDELEFNRIQAKFIEGNEDSLRVMERLGMKFEGYMYKAMLVKGEYKTIGMSSIVKE